MQPFRYRGFGLATAEAMSVELVSLRRDVGVVRSVVGSVTSLISCATCVGAVLYFFLAVNHETSYLGSQCDRAPMTPN